MEGTEFFRTYTIAHSGQIPDFKEQQHPCIYLIGLPERTIPLGVKLGLSTDEHGAYFKRSDQVDLNALQAAITPGAGVMLPYIARPVKQPMIADLIPATAFGSSLNNLVTGSTYEKIREKTVHATGNVCMMCGYFSAHKLRDAHEVWSYREAALPGHIGKQTLKGVIALCAPCHETFHLGFANVQGRLEIALERYSALVSPEFTMIHAYEYCHYVGDVWEKRSEHQWGMDVSIFAKVFPESDPMLVKSGWALQPDKTLFNEKSEVQTVLTGVHWKYPGKDHTQVNYLDPQELT